MSQETAITVKTTLCNNLSFISRMNEWILGNIFGKTFIKLYILDFIVYLIEGTSQYGGVT